MTFVVNVIDNEAVFKDSLQQIEMFGGLYANGIAKDTQNRV